MIPRTNLFSMSMAAPRNDQTAPAPAGWVVERDHSSRSKRLAEACLLGRSRFVKSLLEGGVSLEQRDDAGNTPLILSAIHGSAETVELLIKAGADVDAFNNTGLTALMEASFWGHRDAAEVLLAGGADVTAIDCAGRTALDWAKREGREEIVRLLGRVLTGYNREGPGR